MGDIIRPIGDFFSSDLLPPWLESHASTIGIANASVFPEPVEALPMTSCPAIIFRIAADCMSVGFVNLSRARQAIICGDRSSGDHFDMSTSSPASSTAASLAEANTLLSSCLSSSVSATLLFFFFCCCVLSFFLVSCVSLVALFLVLLSVPVASRSEGELSFSSCAEVSTGSSPKPSNSSPSSSAGVGASSVVTWFDVSAPVDQVAEVTEGMAYKLDHVPIAHDVDA